MAIKMEPNEAFRAVNLVVGAFMIIGGVFLFIAGGFQPLVIGIYTVLFGAAVIVLEFKSAVQLEKYCSFLFSFFGRGLFYIFVGCIILSGGVYHILSGVIVISAGILYCVLEYSKFELPDSMKPNSDTEAV